MPLSNETKGAILAAVGIAASVAVALTQGEQEDKRKCEEVSARCWAEVAGEKSELVGRALKCEDGFFLLPPFDKLNVNKSQCQFTDCKLGDCRPKEKIEELLTEFSCATRVSEADKCFWNGKEAAIGFVMIPGSFEGDGCVRRPCIDDDKPWIPKGGWPNKLPGVKK